MTQGVLTAIIVGVFSVISAVLSAIITKHGTAFWRGTTVIKLRGTAEELRAIQSNGTIRNQSRGYAYDVRDGTIKIRGSRVWLSALLTTTEGDNIVSDGRVSGVGRLTNGVAYVVYTVKDAQHNQQWTGLLLLRIPGLGDLTGYWLTEDHIDPGIVAFGKMVLQRC